MGLRDEICFVSTGQCGGNIGLLFQKQGYNVFYINTAQGDLDTLHGATHIYQIPGERGCNQDQEKGQEIYSIYNATILEQICKFIDGRIVFFICSAGGGSGGGMTPLMVEQYVDYLHKMEDKEWDAYDTACDKGFDPKPPISRKAGLITVIPSVGESPQINANAYNFIKQIADLTTRAVTGEVTNLASTFLIDNENVKDILSINSNFVTLFDEFINIPVKHKSIRGNVDEADLESALITPGITLLGGISRAECETRDLLRCISNSEIFAPSEGKTALYWVSSTVEPVDSIALEKEFGAPKTSFATYNDYENLIMLSGLGFPMERINIMAERAKEYQRQTIKGQQDLAATQLTDDLSFLKEPVKFERARRLQPDLINDTNEVIVPKPTNIQDKLNNFRSRRR